VLWRQLAGVSQREYRETCHHRTRGYGQQAERAFMPEGARATISNGQGNALANTPPGQ
jgi:hypothetical protein